MYLAIASVAIERPVLASHAQGLKEIILAIEGDGLLDVLRHSNPGRYSNQRVLVVDVDGYAHLVPFVEEAEYYFLKTIIPSRKATRDYLRKGESDETKGG